MIFSTSTYATKFFLQKMVYYTNTRFYYVQTFMIHTKNGELYSSLTFFLIVIFQYHNGISFVENKQTKKEKDQDT